MLVACSGGPDSLALAAGAALTGRPMGAVVVDHGLQKGSADVAAWTAQTCEALGLAPVFVRAVSVDGPSVGRRPRPGSPATARCEPSPTNAGRARSCSGTPSTIRPRPSCCGWHVDRAPGVCRRWRRWTAICGGRCWGCGGRTCAGPVTRPGWLPTRTLHNADDRFARARIRHHGLPALVEDLGDGVVLGLARTAASLREDNAALDRWAEQITVTDGDQCRQRRSPTSVAFRGPSRLRVIRRMVLLAGTPGAALSRDHLLGVDTLVTAWTGQGPLDLPGGVRATRESGRLVLHRASGRHSAR